MNELRAKFPSEPAVRLLANESNIGFGAGINHALTALRELGDVGPVLLVNNDAMVPVGLRYALTNALRSNPNLTLIAPCTRQGGEIQRWLYYHRWFGLVTRRPIWGSFSYLSGCCLYVNQGKNAYPLFDEDFFMYGEDVELCHRVLARGGRLHLLEGPVVSHRGSASSGQSTPLYEWHLVRGHWLLARKLAPNGFAWFGMLALRLPVLLARACLRCIRYCSTQPVRSFISATVTCRSRRPGL